ncbi:CPBP family intramembrane metalloprotease [Romboutsia ilealis]|uniref:CPBP family intramembrane metalloprotease n=1 Tax=Romboutsia faecis TaxID=2764597 RepID=A0ABR7JQX1_9FIRM|nr:CPBP family glutamic-type intramembrane protease [Romboutsia faecis]MBC5997305.1 CPBP family intramembrane metalloprotease [Romboutsia faecis]MRN23587.1 CPBP family intramembrane metalloprotease [Romboutsia ilealis]
MKSRANYKEYIIDVILILFVVQLARIITKYILLKQLNFNLLNLIITTAISFALLSILLILILKNNEIFNPTNLKIVNMFNNKNKQIRILLGIIVILTFMITQYFEDTYNIYNFGRLILLIIIIPIFEELLFREYLWNYLSNHIKNVMVVFISITMLYTFYQIGYIDIISQYISITNKSGYTIDIVTSSMIKAFVLGSILGVVKIRLKDTYICMLLHALFSILFY